MTRPAVLESRKWALALGALSLLGICLVGVLVLWAGLLFSSFTGEQPASLHSPLHANYSADGRAIRFPALNIGVVEEAIRDQATSTAEAQEQWATLVVVIQTPVATVTPYFTRAAPTAVPPTLSHPSATPGLPGFTPSASASPSISPTTTQTTTMTLTATVFVPITPTKKPTLTLTLGPNKPTLTWTASPTRTPIGFPTFTPTPTKWITFTPTPTDTPVPSKTATPTPTTTVTSSSTSTFTPTPSRTPTPTLPPYPPPSTPYP